MNILDRIYLAWLNFKFDATSFYNAYIVKGWYTKWSTWLIGAALVAPNLVDFALTNLDMLGAVAPLSTEAREQLRFWLTVAAFVLRQIQQPKKEPTP